MGSACTKHGRPHAHETIRAVPQVSAGRSQKSGTTTATGSSILTLTGSQEATSSAAEIDSQAEVLLALQKTPKKSGKVKEHKSPGRGFFGFFRRKRKRDDEKSDVEVVEEKEDTEEGNDESEKEVSEQAEESEKETSIDSVIDEEEDVKSVISVKKIETLRADQPEDVDDTSYSTDSNIPDLQDMAESEASIPRTPQAETPVEQIHRETIEKTPVFDEISEEDSVSNYYVHSPRTPRFERANVEGRSLLQEPVQNPSFEETSGEVTVSTLNGNSPRTPTGDHFHKAPIRQASLGEISEEDSISNYSEVASDMLSTDIQDKIEQENHEELFSSFTNQNMTDDWRTHMLNVQILYQGQGLSPAKKDWLGQQVSGLVNLLLAKTEIPKSLAFSRGATGRKILKMEDQSDGDDSDEDDSSATQIEENSSKLQKTQKHVGESFRNFWQRNVSRQQKPPTPRARRIHRKINKMLLLDSDTDSDIDFGDNGPMSILKRGRRVQKHSRSSYGNVIDELSDKLFERKLMKSSESSSSANTFYSVQEEIKEINLPNPKQMANSPYCHVTIDEVVSEPASNGKPQFRSVSEPFIDASSQGEGASDMTNQRENLPENPSASSPEIFLPHERHVCKDVNHMAERRMCFEQNLPILSRSPSPFTKEIRQSLQVMYDSSAAFFSSSSGKSSEEEVQVTPRAECSVLAKDNLKTQSTPIKDYRQRSHRAPRSLSEQKVTSHSPRQHGTSAPVTVYVKESKVSHQDTKKRIGHGRSAAKQALNKQQVQSTPPPEDYINKLKQFLEEDKNDKRQQSPTIYKQRVIPSPEAYARGSKKYHGESDDRRGRSHALQVLSNQWVESAPAPEVRTKRSKHSHADHRVKGGRSPVQQVISERRVKVTPSPEARGPKHSDEGVQDEICHSPAQQVVSKHRTRSTPSPEVSFLTEQEIIKSQHRRRSGKSPSSQSQGHGKSPLRVLPPSHRQSSRIASPRIITDVAYRQENIIVPKPTYPSKEKVTDDVSLPEKSHSQKSKSSTKQKKTPTFVYVTENGAKMYEEVQATDSGYRPGEKQTEKSGDLSPWKKENTATENFVPLLRTPSTRKTHRKNVTGSASERVKSSDQLRLKSEGKVRSRATGKHMSNVLESLGVETECTPPRFSFSSTSPTVLNDVKKKTVCSPKRKSPRLIESFSIEASHGATKTQGSPHRVAGKPARTKKQSRVKFKDLPEEESTVVPKQFPNETPLTALYSASNPSLLATPTNYQNPFLFTTHSSLNAQTPSYSHFAGLQTSNFVHPGLLTQSTVPGNNVLQFSNARQHTQPWTTMYDANQLQQQYVSPSRISFPGMYLPSTPMAPNQPYEYTQTPISVQNGTPGMFQHNMQQQAELPREFIKNENQQQSKAAAVMPSNDALSSSQTASAPKTPRSQAQVSFASDNLTNQVKAKSDDKIWNEREEKLQTQAVKTKHLSASDNFLNETPPKPRKWRQCEKERDDGDAWWMPKDWAKQRGIGSYGSEWEFEKEKNKKKEKELQIAKDANIEQIRMSRFVPL